MIKLKSPSEQKKMRLAGKNLAGAFLRIFDLVKPGTTTAEIDRLFEDSIRSKGGRPAFKGYKGGGAKPFPASTCISINEEVVHGIPSGRILKTGQIVGIDAGIELDGWYGDMACSFLVGEVDESYRKLWRVTRETLYTGIEQARPGNSIHDIGGAIQDYVESHGFSVIRDLVGHGIGANLHEEPAVPNYRSSGSHTRLRSGMTIAIEPMVSMGNWNIRVLRDGWTAVTTDGSPSAHFEHTVLITDGDPEILTLLEDGSDPWQVAANYWE